MNYFLPVIVVMLCAASCDGGGAEVNLNQTQGQDQRPDLNPVPTPFDPGPFCEKTCNRRFNGLIEVLVTCADGTHSIDVVPFLPRDCDIVNEVTPVTQNDGGGISGQHTK